MTNQIGSILNLTTSVVETYIDHLMKKLDCQTKNDIVVKFFNLEVPYTVSYKYGIYIIYIINLC